MLAVQNREDLIDIQSKAICWEEKMKLKNRTISNDQGNHLACKWED